MPVIEEVNNQLGGDNDAGLKRNYYFGLAADVETWPGQTEPATTYEEKTTQTSAVEMKTGKRMWPVQMTVNSDNGLKSESAGSVGSLSAKNSLRGKNARVNAKMCGWLEEHKNDELFFIVEENNGQNIFFGSENVPAMFTSFNVDRGGKVDDEKMISFELDNFGRLPMFYGTPAVPLAIPLTEAV